MLAAIGMCAIAPSVAVAQSQTEYEVAHQMIETDRQAIVAMNLPLNDEEAKEFWPLYQEYRSKIKEMDDVRRELLKEFAGNFENLAAEDAQKITKRALALDVDRQRAKRRYLNKFDGIITGARLFRFYQIETKLEAITRFGWTRQIPLALVSEDDVESNEVIEQ